ncbi:MAG TPA: glycosyl hydrolase family 8 [Opitutaceae bacterium]|jgi:oligosaccharide reducing-end xylanase
MRASALAILLLAPSVVPAADLPACRNLFSSILGKSGAETDGKISGAWHQLFRGRGTTQRLFYPVEGDMAYVPDIANGDVRTEGLSYGMMISVETDHREDFDRIWKWAKTYLYHRDGPARGLFAWHATFEGRPLDPGPASDGEEWFLTALFFASHRWGDGAGILNYSSEAQALLKAMLHKSEEPDRDGYVDMIDRQSREVVFVPHGDGALFTDPSYHLPAFYELWARWAASPADQAFLRSVAARSRKLFRQAANPTTGLMPDYCEFDGRPHARRGHEDFRFDAWRTLSNPAVDYAWDATDPWEVGQSNRVLRFLSTPGAQGHDRFRIDGTPVGDDPHSPGLLAMAATAGQAADPTLARPFVQALWDMDVPSGRYRYYNGLLYMLALLEDGGRFRAFAPGGPG